MQLERKNISDMAADAVLERIVDGRLPDGQRINEVQLSEELGVSRTPLREGLGRLVSEEVVFTEPRRGFFVAPLTVSEFEQLYDIRPLLDPEALRLAGIPDEARLASLGKLNRKLMSTRKASLAIDTDNAWHLGLIENCPNKVMLSLIEHFISRTRRYEHALFRETRNVWVAGTEHDQILEALRQRDLDAACAGLKRNLQSGKEPITEWLMARNN